MGEHLPWRSSAHEGRRSGFLCSGEGVYQGRLPGWVGKYVNSCVHVGIMMPSMVSLICVEVEALRVSCFYDTFNIIEYIAF